MGLGNLCALVRFVCELIIQLLHVFACMRLTLFGAPTLSVTFQSSLNTTET